MFKVSFKETPKSPSKLITKSGAVTNCTLMGSVSLPEFFDYLPPHINMWISKVDYVEIYEDVANHKMIIFSSGVAKCSPNDRYDTILGERIAESRAKYCIYKFFYNFTKKVISYYYELILGMPCEVNCKDGTLASDNIKYEKLMRREEKHLEELINGKKNE